MMRWHALIILSGLLFAAPAAAEEERLRLSGFGTLGLSWFSADYADYVQGGQPEGPGRSGQFDAGLDSLLAVQADAAFTDTLSGTLQAMSQRNADGSFTPFIRLANLQYSPDQSLTIRAGRIPNYIGVLTDHRLANLAHPWVRPPAEIYGLLTPRPVDGIDAIWRRPVGDGEFRLQAGWLDYEYEFARSNVSGTDSVEVRQFFVSPHLTWGDFQAEISYGRGKSEYLPGQLETLIDTFPSGFDEQSDIQVLSASVAHDSASWLLMAEWAWVRVDDGWYIRDRQGAYLTVGRHFGDTTPYATLARRASRDGRSDYPGNGIGLPDSLRSNQTSIALGVSHALSDSMVVKAQVDFIQPDKNSNGLYFNVDAANYDRADPPLETLISVNLDFLF